MWRVSFWTVRHDDGIVIYKELSFCGGRTVSEDCLFEPIPISYDGRDAQRHELELYSLGQSAQGLSRILSVSGQFVLTNRYTKHLDAMDVRVLVGTPVSGSWEIVAKLKEVSQGFLFKGAGAAFGKLLSYIMAKLAGRKDAQERFDEFARFAIEQQRLQSEQVTKMQLETLERMVRDLRPSAKLALAPIGNTCNTMRIGKAEYNSPELDIVDKEVVNEGPDVVITETDVHAVFISELDVKTGGCRVSYPDNVERRHRGVITDPIVYQPNNPYANAMTTQIILNVYAKITLKDGIIHKIFISDLAS